MSGLIFSFDDLSMKQFTGLIGWEGMRSPEMVLALDEAADLVVGLEKSHQHWKTNSPGGLVDDMHKVVESPYEIQIGTDLPYGPRRNWGFEGPDRLGRVYHDVGAFFMEAAEDEARDPVLERLVLGMEAYLRRVAAV